MFIRAIFGENKNQPKEEELDIMNRISKGIKQSQKVNQINIDNIIGELFPNLSKLSEFDLNEMVEEMVCRINVSSMLGKDAMKDFWEIKNSIAGIEFYGLKFMSMFFPNAPFGTSKKAREFKKKAIEVLKPHIIQRKQSKKEMDDYLSVWAHSPHVSGEKKGQEYTDEEITNQIINIIIAAHLNTAVTVNYSLIYLFRNPKFLEQLRNELLEMKEDGKDLTSSKLLNFAIRETMRMTNSPGVIRRVEEDFIHEGYLLEKGYLVSTIIAHIHFDPKIFPDPLTFKPERWEDPSLIRCGFWFGSGVHRCKGDAYALQIIKSVIIEMVLNWNLEFKNKTDSDFDLDYLRNRKTKKTIFASLKKI